MIFVLLWGSATALRFPSLSRASSAGCSQRQLLHAGCLLVGLGLAIFSVMRCFHGSCRLLHTTLSSLLAALQFGLPGITVKLTGCGLNRCPMLSASNQKQHSRLQPRGFHDGGHSSMTCCCRSSREPHFSLWPMPGLHSASGMTFVLVVCWLRSSSEGYRFVILSA